MAEPEPLASICVLDIGKTNVKLNAMTATGGVVETVAIANPVRPGPPWQHHDLAGLGGWIFEELAALSRRHPLQTLV